MTRLILVRHGETDWSRENRIQGWLDIPLNDKGRRQAIQLANELGRFKIDILYSSPLSRSYETAREIARLQNIKVRKLSALRELNQGIWQGLLVEEARKRYRKTYTCWEDSPLSVSPPKGETIEALRNRVISVVNRLINKHRDRTICLVAHKVINAVIKSHYLKLDLNKLWQILPEEGTWEVLDISDGQ